MNRREKSVLAYIGMGSNLGNPVEQISSARRKIAMLDQVDEVAISSFYSSPPMGPQDQPDYVNAVMAVRTSLPAMDLLRELQQIENRHGRVRKEHWGARTLDLDVLLFGDQRIERGNLIVPHVGIAERAFVLYPLQEIAPADLCIPGYGLLKELVKQCPRDGLRRVTI